MNTTGSSDRIAVFRSPLRVRRRGGHHDAEARDVREDRIVAAGMVGGRGVPHPTQPRRTIGIRRRPSDMYWTFDVWLSSSRARSSAKSKNM